MMREGESLSELESSLACLVAERYQTCGTMPLGALERLCRRINGIRLRINSFKEGRYGKRK